MAQGRRIAAYLGQGHVTNTWQFGSESTYDDTALKNKINGVSETLSQLQGTVAQLPTTDNDTIYDDTQVRSLIESLQEQVDQLPTEDTNTVYDDAEVRSLITSLQETVAQLPTTDNDTIYDDTEVRALLGQAQQNITTLQNIVAALPTTDNDTQADWNVTDTTSPAFIANKPTIPAAMIAEYQQTTAQEIAEFLDENPAAPLIIKQTNGSMLTAIYANKQSDSKVNVRCIGTIQGEYYVFDHTVDGSSWTATTYPFHDGVGGSSTSWNDLTDKPALFSGSYNDLTDKPTLLSCSWNTLTDKPTIPDAQVNADWNETDSTSKAFIENKPALPDFSLVPQVKLVTAAEEEISIPVGGRVNKQPVFVSLPDGYEVYAYRQISIERATSLVGNNTDPKYDTWMKVFIQSFSTTGGGTKANISMVNSGTTDALVRLKITALAMKIGV